jgi:hypothetical protein
MRWEGRALKLCYATSFCAACHDAPLAVCFVAVSLPPGLLGPLSRWPTILGLAPPLWRKSSLAHYFLVTTLDCCCPRPSSLEAPPL